MSGFRNLLPRTKPTLQYYGFVAVYTSAVIGFLIMRIAEIASLGATNPLYVLMLCAVIIGILTLIVNPPPIVASIVRRAGMILVVLASLKNEIDPGMKKIAGKYDLTGSIAVVTGANKGTGVGIVQILASKGAEVIMACRSLSRCRTAQTELEAILLKEYTTLYEKANKTNTSFPIAVGKLHVMQLDLGDLTSIRTFVDNLSGTFPRVDILVNNAGLMSAPGARTVQGYEEMFGVMHLGHFALTKWMMPMLLKTESILHVDEKTEDVVSNHTSLVYDWKTSARIINIASQSYVTGVFDASLMVDDGTGDMHGEITDNCKWKMSMDVMCALVNGYGRAKLANILHIHELQRRTDLLALQAMQSGQPVLRRLVTASIHPGTVQTEIISMFHSAWMNLLLRSPVESAMITLKAIESNKYLPSSYIDAMGTAHDLQEYRDNHLHVHLAAYPKVVEEKDSKYPFVRVPSIIMKSVDKWVYSKMRMVVKPDGSVIPPAEVAARLFDVSEGIVTKWENSQSS